MTQSDAIWWSMRKPSEDSHAVLPLPVAISLEYEEQPKKRSEEPNTSSLCKWLKLRHKFRDMTYFIVSAVERMQVPIERDDLLELRILCENRPSNKDISFVEGTAIVPIHCTPNDVFVMSSDDIAEWVVSIVDEACSALTSLTGISTCEIQDACKRIEVSDFTNEWVWGEAWSPKGDHKAIVSVIQSTTETRITLAVVDRNGHLVMERTIVDSPYLPDLWKRYLRELVWLSDSKACLVTDDGRITVEI